ncbi:NUDIX domain-containing protein [Cohnella sp. JJ-181]|uniref:NUDIX domain-containing protein n=1 Tax=Cohnella rhizoplanae TaxID=2974897 RepID=UPI0022FF6FE0|nr:NUDIX hydrolase [Cohnella sp. JJ-181]CAI6056656.1 Methanol dehydrogenase activator [Cohnella sp. JJ-181]
MNDNEWNENGGRHPFYEETVSTDKRFEGRMISLQVDTVRLPNGDTATREIVKHPGAVAVIAVLDGKMLVVEQFRKPLERVQVEIPAGKLDAGEEPETAAMRELEEETGYRAKRIRHVRTFSTSPGFADELIYLYFTDELEPGQAHLDDEEFLTCEGLTPEQADEYVRDGRIFDAKTLLAVLIWRNWRETGAFGA